MAYLKSNTPQKHINLNICQQNIRTGDKSPPFLCCLLAAVNKEALLPTYQYENICSHRNFPWGSVGTSVIMFMFLTIHKMYNFLWKKSCLHGVLNRKFSTHQYEWDSRVGIDPQVRRLAFDCLCIVSCRKCFEVKWHAILAVLAASSDMVYTCFCIDWASMNYFVSRR